MCYHPRTIGLWLGNVLFLFCSRNSKVWRKLWENMSQIQQRVEKNWRFQVEIQQNKTNNSPRMKEFQKSAILEIKYFRSTFSSNIEQLESHFFCCQVTFLLLCKVVLQNVVCMYFASVPLRLRWCLICLQMWIQSFLYYMYFKEIGEGRYFFFILGRKQGTWILLSSILAWFF